MTRHPIFYIPICIIVGTTIGALVLISVYPSFSVHAAGPQVQSCATPPPPNAAQRLALVSTRDRQQGIYMLNPDGSARGCVVTLVNAAAAAPAFSPDGKHIGFVLIDAANPTRDGFILYIVGSDGSNPHPLVKSSNFSWSPDNTHIAYSSQGDIYLTDLSGANPRNLTGNHAGDFSPAFSPDGTHIAFSQPDGIYVINVDGSNSVNLTHGNNTDLYPIWSPDGMNILFNSTRDGSEQLYVVGLNNKTPTRITDVKTRNLAPSWSPDGKQIAYVSVPARDDRQSRVMVVSSDGSAPHRLTKNNYAEMNPVWSHDSIRLAFEVRIDPHGAQDVYVTDANGSNQHNLTVNPASDGMPFWEP